VNSRFLGFEFPFMAFQIPGCMISNFSEDVELVGVSGKARRIFPVNSRFHGNLDPHPVGRLVSILGQHRTREMEGAADQDAGESGVGGDGAKGGGDRRRFVRREAYGAGGGGDRG
jgi:hypothetical protein